MRDRWAIILAGGDGTRLQSMTRAITGENRPKHSCKVMVGTVNANREYFEMGVKDLAQAEAEYPGWLRQLLTHPVKGLDNYGELFAKTDEPQRRDQGVL